jgi:hypothetical protein
MDLGVCVVVVFKRDRKESRHMNPQGGGGIKNIRGKNGEQKINASEGQKSGERGKAKGKV